MCTNHHPLRASIASTCAASVMLLASCAGTPETASQAGSPASLSQPPATSPPEAAAPARVNTLGHDRGMWQQLLSESAKIRRTVTFTASGVEATTESDDPEVAARIIEHAKAMQARIQSGARVRVWDPVFAELFKNHEAVKLEVTPTERGVTIVESSNDPEAVALLWSHASGVNDFVREGHAAGRRETPRLKEGTPPPPELAIGGVRHRFLLAQPSAEQLAGLSAAGVKAVVNFRPATEHEGYDEKTAAADAGLGYCNLPYASVGELTDELIDSARAAIRNFDAKGETAALHCRTGNRVGPGWAAYRALDVGVPLDQAMAEAKALRMLAPAMEAKTRDYIERRSAAAGTPRG